MPRAHVCREIAVACGAVHLTYSTSLFTKVRVAKVGFSLAPVSIIGTIAEILMDRGVRPIERRFYKAVLNRIVMDVIDMRVEVGLVTDDVVPEPVLPHATGFRPLM